MFFINNGSCFHNVCQNKSRKEIIEICIVILSRNRSLVLGKTNPEIQAGIHLVYKVVYFYEPATWNAIFARGLFDFRLLFSDRSKSPRSRKSDLYRAINDKTTVLPAISTIPIVRFRFSLPVASYLFFFFQPLFFLFLSFSCGSFVCTTTFTREYTCILYASGRCLSTSTHIPYKRLSDVVVIARGRTENRSSIYNTI